MDIFEQEGLERQLRGILLAWGSFKAAFPKLLDSYKTHTEEGRNYGAEIEEPDESSVVIVCQRGGAPKTPFSSLTIRVRAEMVSEGKYSVECKIEEWRRPPVGSLSLEWEKSMIFVLAKDNASLILGKEILTAAQAAGKLLETALLPK